MRYYTPIYLLVVGGIEILPVAYLTEKQAMRAKKEKEKNSYYKDLQIEIVSIKLLENP